MGESIRDRVMVGMVSIADARGAGGDVRGGWVVLLMKIAYLGGGQLVRGDENSN